MAAPSVTRKPPGLVRPSRAFFTPCSSVFYIDRYLTLGYHTVMKLYRATNHKSDAKTVPAGSCWTDSYEHAEAYTRNQGYGGKYIISIEIEPAAALDLRGNGWEHDDLGALADALGYDPRETWTDGDLEYPEQALDSEIIRGELAAAGYAWAIYHDTYPANCTTYRRL